MAATETRTVGKRTVRILLECFLVNFILALVNKTVFNGECDTCSEVPQSLPLEALVDYVMPVVISDVRYGGSEPFIAVVKEDEVGEFPQVVI